MATFEDNLAQFIRLGNIFNPDTPIMDDPRRGGISGTLPRTDPFGVPARDREDSWFNHSIGDRTRESMAPADDILRPAIEPIRARDTAYRPNRDAVAAEDTLMTPERRVNAQALGEVDYTPETGMQDRFRSHIDTMPTRNKPGILDRIMGGLSRDPATADRIKYGGYNQALSDWKMKADVLGSASAQESTFNRNAANQALQETRREIEAQRLALDTLKNQQIYETKVTQLEQAAQRAEDARKAAEERIALGDRTIAARMDMQNATIQSLEARQQAELARRDAQIEMQRLRNEVLASQGDRRLNQGDRRLDFDELPEYLDEQIYDENGNLLEGRRRTSGRGAPPPSGGGLSKPPANSVPMIGKDGKTYNIPKDKVEQARKDGFTHPRPKRK